MFDEPTLTPDPANVFQFFNEVGIINQPSRALIEAWLPNCVTVQHFSLLNYLSRLRDGKTPLQIARAFQTPKASLKNTLAGLEKRNLIKMQPSPKDGRSKLVMLTDVGRTFRLDAIRSLHPDILALTDKLDFATVAVLTPRLAEIRRVLDENRRDET